MTKHLQNWRHARRRRAKRRREFVRSAVTEIRADSFTDEEAADLLFSDLRSAKRAAARAARRQLTARAQPSDQRRAGAGGGPPANIPRPQRQLSRLNRTRVFPPLVPPLVDVLATRAVSVVELLKHCGRNWPASRRLDALAYQTGLSLQSSADILFACRLTPAPLRRSEIAAVAEARRFWRAYELGRARYRALVATKITRPVAGDWAHFEHVGLECALPRLTVPRRLRRHEYLINVVELTDSIELDVYDAATVQPLFSHSFPQKFSPVRFGVYAGRSSSGLGYLA